MTTLTLNPYKGSHVVHSVWDGAQYRQCRTPVGFHMCPCGEYQFIWMETGSSG